MASDNFEAQEQVAKSSDNHPNHCYNSPEVPDSDASEQFHYFEFAAGKQRKARRGALHTPPCRISVLSSQMSDPGLQYKQKKKQIKKKQ